MTDKCPKCGADEVEAFTPRTVYGCGSSDYDQRPGTFKQSQGCATIAAQRERIKRLEEALETIAFKPFVSTFEWRKLAIKALEAAPPEGKK